MLVLVIPLHQIIKICLIQLIRLYKEIRLLCKVTKPCKVDELLYKLMELYKKLITKTLMQNFSGSIKVKLYMLPSYKM